MFDDGKAKAEVYDEIIQFLQLKQAESMKGLGEPPAPAMPAEGMPPPGPELPPEGLPPETLPADAIEAQVPEDEEDDEAALLKLKKGLK